jgi:NDP-sugar pyrophosphorylase family protein
MMSMETGIIPALLDSHAKIFVHDVGDAPFIDIGTPETLKVAGDFLLQNDCYWKTK